MAVDLYDKQFERALTMLVNPTLDVSVLTSAPQAGLLLQSLCILAACTMDASLVNEKTKNTIKLLRTPMSFRASLYQTSQAMTDAFRTAHQSMLAIQINLDDVPDVITSIIRAYAKPEDRGSNFVMNMQMKSFEEIVKLCTEESKKATVAFDDTLGLIRELMEVTTATAGDNEEKVEEAKKLLMGFDEQKKHLAEEKQILQKKIEEQGKQIRKAQADYDRTARKIIKSTGFWATLSRSFAQAIGGVINLFTSTIGAKILKVTPPTAGGGGGDSNNNGSVTKPLVYSPRLADLLETNNDQMKDVLEKAVEMYKFQREMEQVLLKEDAANRQAIAEIATKVSNTNKDLLDFKDIILYLFKGVEILGQAQEQWTRLQNFFASLHTVVVGPMTRSLLAFDQIVQQKELLESGVLRKELVINGFKAATTCINVARAANIYIGVSNSYVLPLIDGSAKKLALSKDEARIEIQHIASKMENVTTHSHNFIQVKLQEAFEKAKQQITDCRDEFRAELGSNSSSGRSIRNV